MKHLILCVGLVTYICALGCRMLPQASGLRFSTQMAPISEYDRYQLQGMQTGAGSFAFAAPYLLFSDARGREFGHYVESLRFVTPGETQLFVVVCTSHPFAVPTNIVSLNRSEYRADWVENGTPIGSVLIDAKKKVVLRIENKEK